MPTMPARILPRTGSLAIARDDGSTEFGMTAEGFGTTAVDYGAGISLLYRFSIPSSFITFSIASTSHGASVETTSAAFSPMKRTSSRRQS
jgi:hypothetical protein